MRKHLSLIALAVLVIGVQITTSYWIVHRNDRAVVDRLDRVHLDTTSGVIYVTYSTRENGEPLTVGMTPRAAIQTETILGQMITNIKRQADAIQ